MLDTLLESRLELTQAPVPSVALFQDFVRELIALKWFAVESVRQTGQAASPAAAGILDRGSAEAAPFSKLPAGEAGRAALPAASEDLNAPTPANAIWNRVVGMLNRQSLEATRLGGPASLEFHREAMYVMAVLADETFLHLDWEGRDYWLHHLIEAHVFRTHAGGDIFFRRVDALLRREDDAAAELAAVYLFAIGLGFRGKYRGAGFSPALDGYRSRLSAFIGRRKPALAQQAKNLFPDAYKNTIHTGIDRPIPSTRKWRVALLCAFLVWLLASQALWWRLSRDLNAQLSKIATLMDSAPAAEPVLPNRNGPIWPGRHPAPAAAHPAKPLPAASAK